MPCPIEPMLATSAQLPPDDGRWAYEPKWDGFRAIVHVDGRAVVWSRRGTDLTDRFPEVAELASAVPPDTVLDGELVVFDGSGRPDFEAIRRRGLLGRIDGAATFIAFDVLCLGGRNLLVQRFRTRRAALEDLALSGPGWCTTPSHEGVGAALFDATREQGLEGVVAKRLDSPYRPGVRTKLWLKVKAPGWAAVHTQRRHSLRERDALPPKPPPGAAHDGVRVVGDGRAAPRASRVGWSNRPILHRSFRRFHPGLPSHSGGLGMTVSSG